MRYRFRNFWHYATRQSHFLALEAPASSVICGWGGIFGMLILDPPSPPPAPRRGGERCHPRGPALSEVARAQQAHWELRSLECSWGREVLSTPQDLPSTGTLPAGLALCATLPVTLWVSQGAPQTTRPVHASGVQSWAGGSCRSPTHRLPQQPRGRAPMPRCWARSTGHTQPPTRTNHGPLENDKGVPLPSWGALFARLPGVLCARAKFFHVFSCITVRDPCFVACPRSMTQFYG